MKQKSAINAIITDNEIFFGFKEEEKLQIFM